MPKRILLCDDEVHILRAAEFKLKRAGYDVQTASDGQEAWEHIQAQPPDILITDCQMPRLDGLGLVGIDHQSGRRFLVLIRDRQGRRQEHQGHDTDRRFHHHPRSHSHRSASMGSSLIGRNRVPNPDGKADTDACTTVCLQLA